MKSKEQITTSLPQDKDVEAAEDTEYSTESLSSVRATLIMAALLIALVGPRHWPASPCHLLDSARLSQGPSQIN